MILTKICL